MLSLQDLLGQEQGGEAVNQISQMIGANQTETNSAIQFALPLILSALAKNASNPQGAESLSNTLQKNHDGSILDRLGGYLNQPDTDDGLGILNHIFGQKQGAAAQQVSQNTGLDMGQVAQLMITLAPIVMAYLGRKKQQENLDADGLSSVLQGQQQQIQSTNNPMMDMISNLLDSNQDGSSMDDLASLAANYMQKNTR
ncbi:MAG: DUF937 domain-containing protein [Acidobacteria bacterium]|nr:DUF937 domain-containing protein [Acidobacteriota bacterium]MCA1640252.1 DUF937 domain-containing protein [Acidobacteriota bacterium]